MTPQHPDLKHIQNYFKTLARNSITSVFSELDVYLSYETHKRNEFTILQSRFNNLNLNYRQGTTRKYESNIDRNQILESTLGFIDYLEYSDFNEKLARDAHKFSLPKVELDDLKEKLQAIIASNRIEPVYGLLKKVLAVNSLRDYINNEIEEQYSEQVWRLNNGKYELLTTWENEYNVLKRKLENVVNLIEVKDLIGDWKTVFANIDSGLRENNISLLFALFSRTDDIEFPEVLYKEVNHDAKKECIIVGDEEKLRFKRLMFLYQDAYQAGNYKLAYEYCKKVREEIEPESPHLYESLMLSHFRLNGNAKIIKKVINQENTENEEYEQHKQEFRYLLVYAHRLSSILEKYSKTLIEQKQAIYKTGYYNIREVATGLMATLQDEYSKIEHEYIIDSKEEKAKEKQNREKIKTCIKIATDITKYVEADVLFAETIVNELAGGGKYKWLEVNDYNDFFSNESEFNAYTFLRNAQKLIKYYKGKDEKKVEDRLVKVLVENLNRKYNYLRSNYLKGEKKDIANHLVDCLTAYKVGIEIFKDYKKDFCDIPIQELSSSESSIVDWFELDYNGELKINSKVKTKEKLNPYEMLEHFVIIRDGKKGWSDIDGIIKNNAYNKLKKRTQLAYNKINPIQRIPEDKDISKLKKVIQCIESWQKCYDLYKEKEFLTYARDELLGNQKLHWFVIATSGIEPDSLPENLGFYTQSKLENYLNIINDGFTIKEAQKIIGENLFKKILKPRYIEIQNELKRANRTQRQKSLRHEVSQILIGFSRLYRFVQPLDTYKDIFFEELVCEHAMPWFVNSERKIISNKQSRKLGFNSKKVLDDMVEEIGKKDDVEFYHEILKWIINNRYLKDDLTSYEEYSDIKSDNYSIDDKKSVFKLLSKFRRYHEITKDQKYLEIPRNEYVLNIGKIKWCWSILGEEFQYSSNSNIRGLSYWNERKYIERHYPIHRKSSEYELQKPWLTPEKEPPQLTSGKNESSKGFAMILNDFFSQKKTISKNDSSKVT